MKIELFYDKECPFCNSYAKYIKLKNEHNLILINARDAITRIESLKVNGYDINDGFIIIVDESKIVQGSDAIIYLNTISQNRVFFPNNYLFKNTIYSSLKLLRKIILFLSLKNYKI